MTTYVALLRGIAPTNPNMRNEKLRGLFEKLGFANVRTVISSGNVIFDSPSKSPGKLEEAIKKALPEELGFTSTTIIRSKAQIQHLVDQDPFKGMEHSQNSYLNVTFLKQRTSIDLKFPYKADHRAYVVLMGVYEGGLCSVIDLTSAATTLSWRVYSLHTAGKIQSNPTISYCGGTSSKTPDLMIWLEKQFGKEITTRTWKTVERISKGMK